MRAEPCCYEDSTEGKALMIFELMGVPDALS